jgi:hypothetical protein
VAYLDDGTMVVVDNARKMISKTIDISVTSVLQTTAGKMIFGKWDERSAARQEAPKVTAVGPLASPGVSSLTDSDAKKTAPVAADRPQG